MRVLSIKEPFATLIKDGVKRIETRSWKTNYRGELYIHASLTKKDITDRHELLELVKDKTFSYGYIICRCKLKDCVYMTKDFVEDIRNNHHQEYICGIYTEGRYAWVLDEIEILDKPIPAKGKLGIWNYDEYFCDFYAKMSTFLVVNFIRKCLYRKMLYFLSLSHFYAKMSLILCCYYFNQ